MAGERTPSVPPLRGSGSADDDISLREHVQRQLDGVQRQLDVIIDGARTRILGVQEHTDAEVAHLKSHVENILEERRISFTGALEAQSELLERTVTEMRVQLDERARESDKRHEQRWTAQEKAVEVALTRLDKEFHEHLSTAMQFQAENDKRYEQRFVAQEMAVNLAHARVDQEFRERIEQVRSETVAALAAADKAITKSEMATEKRFECVSADTPILCADLIWRPAGDLLVGDELVAFDEEALTRRGRRYRRATVTANSIERDALLSVNTSVGSVRCNHKHPWLVRRTPTSNWLWMKASDIQPGFAVVHALDPWVVDRSWAAGWLAGMYDGEGCLTLDRNHRSQLTMSQRESPTSDNILLALKEIVDRVGVYRLEPGTPSTRRNTQPFIHFTVTRVPDVLRILGTVRPPRLLAKADGVWESKPLGSWGRAAVVESVESVGTGLIACLSTSTHTYIADGFAMHNSVNEFRAQLSDQAATFMGRSESLSRHDRTAEALNEMSRRQEQGMTLARERLDAESRLARERFDADMDAIRDRFANDITTINSRLDRMQGTSVGGREAIMDKRTANGAVLALVGMGITVVLAVLAVLTFILAQSGNP